MQIYTENEAQKDFSALVKHVGNVHEIVYIVSDQHKVAMISEEQLRGILETLHLLSIPGMRESILEARGEPLEQGSEQLEW